MSLGEILVLYVFRIYFCVKESCYVYRNSSWLYVNIIKSTKVCRNRPMTKHNPPMKSASEIRKKIFMLSTNHVSLHIRANYYKCPGEGHQKEHKKFRIFVSLNFRVKESQSRSHRECNQGVATSLTILAYIEGKDLRARCNHNLSGPITWQWMYVMKEPQNPNCLHIVLVSIYRNFCYNVCSLLLIANMMMILAAKVQWWFKNCVASMNPFINWSRERINITIKYSR